MADKKDSGKKKEPTAAPGLNDRKFGEDATPEDMEKGNYTKVTRVFLDENDPSGERLPHSRNKRL